MIEGTLKNYLNTDYYLLYVQTPKISKSLSFLIDKGIFKDYIIS